MYLLPSFTLGFIYAGVYARFVRNSMLDILNSEYITFLRAKGLSERKIIVHTLKNAMIPIITVVGFSFSSLLGGAVLIEIVFNLPELGKVLYYSLFLFDIVVNNGNDSLFRNSYNTYEFVY